MNNTLGLLFMNFKKHPWAAISGIIIGFAMGYHIGMFI